MIKAFIFDCFGVIYRDAFKDFLYANAIALSDSLKDKSLLSIGFPRYYYELARKNDMGEISDDEFYCTLSDATHITAEKIKQLMNETESMLNDDVIEFIKKLNRKYKTALVANADRQFLQKFLNYKNINKLFDYVLTSSEAGVQKPDLQFFKIVIKHMDVNLDEILYIDDSQLNVQTAKSFGIHAIQFVNLGNLKADVNQLKIP